MLKNAPVSPRRRQAGLSLAAGLVLAVSTLAWAAQPAQAPTDRPQDGGMGASGIQGSAPAYPKAAADAGQGGLVMLRVLVGADGQAQEVEIDAEKSTVPADSELAQSAVEAAGKWTFQPGVKDGKYVPGWVTVPVRFEPPTETPEAGPTAEGA